MSLKNGIEREFDIPIRLRAGAPGSFEILVNGERVYSKKQSGRLPNLDELSKLLRDKLPRNELPNSHTKP